MKRDEAIRIICEKLGGDLPLITSTGLMSRELFNFQDNDSHFYMVGSMGLASAIGLGLSLSIDGGKKVFVLDGDASLLMGLNNISNIALHQPSGLVHLVMDNNAYASCGEERTASHQIRIDMIAAAAGYKKVVIANDAVELERELGTSLKAEGPIMILIRIDLGGRRDLPRPLNLPEVAKRFKSFISCYEEKNTK